VGSQDSSRDAATPVYSNYLRVGCNAFEFLLDFSDYREGDTEPRSVVVVVTSPVFAKAFGKTLQQALSDYEERFGAIPDALP
jgi:hypothetical protein